MEFGVFEWLVIGSGIAALAYGIINFALILKLPAGNDVMRSIGAAIQEGARAYLNRQYRTIAVVGVIIDALLF